VADDALKQKIKDKLTSAYFGGPEDAVSVSDSDVPGDGIHVVVVSPKFRGKRLAEKTDLILSQLYQSLSPDEWGKVTLSVGVSPEAVKAL
jgi:acid stress-induced BolA-like protein IbaG/YrbA